MYFLILPLYLSHFIHTYSLMLPPSWLQISKTTPSNLCFLKWNKKWTSLIKYVLLQACTQDKLEFLNLKVQKGGLTLCDKKMLFVEPKGRPLFLSGRLCRLENCTSIQAHHYGHCRDIMYPTALTLLYRSNTFKISIIKLRTTKKAMLCEIKETVELNSINVGLF